MPDIEKEIERRVDAFVDDLRELLRKAALQQAADILAEQAKAPSSRGAGKTAAHSAAASRNGRRSPAQLDRLTQRLMAEIKTEPGRRVEEIAKSMSAATKDLVIPLRRLLDDKQISRKGQRRATRYYPKNRAKK